MKKKKKEPEVAILRNLPKNSPPSSIPIPKFAVSQPKLKIAPSPSQVARVKPRASRKARPLRTPSSEQSGGGSSKRQAILQQAAAARLQKYGAQMKTTVLSKSFVERRSVQEPVGRGYKKRRYAFLPWCLQARMPLTTAAHIDGALTLQMSESFCDGLPGTVGRKQLAALGYCVLFLTRGSPNRLERAWLRWDGNGFRPRPRACQRPGS